MFGETADLASLAETFFIPQTGGSSSGTSGLNVPTSFRATHTESSALKSHVLIEPWREGSSTGGIKRSEAGVMLLGFTGIRSDVESHAE